MPHHIPPCSTEELLNTFRDTDLSDSGDLEAFLFLIAIYRGELEEVVEEKLTDLPTDWNSINAIRQDIYFLIIQA